MTPCFISGLTRLQCHSSVSVESSDAQKAYSAHERERGLSIMLNQLWYAGILGLALIARY